jgi:hypothetical protein
MAEFSKEMKFVLIINLIVAFVYGIMYLFLPEAVYSLNDAPYFDPHFWRLFGGVLIAMGIPVLLGIIKGDWDYIKLFFLFAIIVLVILVLVNLTSNIYVIPRSATNLVFHWLDTIVMIVLVVFNTFFYLREEKK